MPWTELSIFQWTVTWSPLVYLLWLSNLLKKLDGPCSRLSERLSNTLSVLLCVYLLVVLIQVFTQEQAVGSAVYSPVQPLYLSGVPAALLTVVVFFSFSKNSLAKALVATVAVLWVAMPIGIDYLYTQQGGYRGSVGDEQIAVLSTIYSFIKNASAFFLLLVFVWAPGILAMAVYSIYRASRRDRLRMASVMFSIMALGVQFLNWGGFVFD